MKFLLLILVFLCAHLNAQNLIINNEFSSNLTGWQLSGEPLPVWDSFDVDGSGVSGSALVVNTSVGTSTDVEVLHQCVENSAGAYLMGAKVFIPDMQKFTGSVVIRYIVRSNTNNCDGPLQATGGALITQTGQWVVLFDDINFVPGGSIEYIIAIRKTEANGEFVAYIDDAYMFSDIIFQDGFED